MMKKSNNNIINDTERKALKTSANTLRESFSNLKSSAQLYLRSSLGVSSKKITQAFKDCFITPIEVINDDSLELSSESFDPSDESIEIEEIEKIEKNDSPPPASSPGPPHRCCNRSHERLRTWNSIRCKNLTWMNKTTIPVDILIQAMNYWQNCCGVRFIKVEEDPFFTFVVAKKSMETHPDNSGVVASSFFPGKESDERKIYIFKRFSSIFNQVAALAHELGHLLGFRHEINTKNNESNQERTDNLVAITDYDPNSIMHCIKIWDDEKNKKITILSELDIIGSQKVYGLPLTTTKK
jgi:hypothetical protein